MASAGGTAAPPALAAPSPAAAPALAVTLAAAPTPNAPPTTAAAEATPLGGRVLLWHHGNDLLRDAQVLDVVPADDHLRQPPETIAIS